MNYENLYQLPVFPTEKLFCKVECSDGKKQETGLLNSLVMSSLYSWHCILQIKLADKVKLHHVSSSVTDAHHFLSNFIYHLKSNFSFEHIYDPIPCLHIDIFVSFKHVHRWTLFFSHEFHSYRISKYFLPLLMPRFL